MTNLFAPYDHVAAFANRQAAWLLPTVARLVFAAVLFSYFWTSAGTKLDGLFTPSLGAYAQVFPRAFEAAGYDVGQMSAWQTLVVLVGAWAEFLLPLLIVLGLCTRLAALGMVGFVLVQSLTDIRGHGAGPETIGAWFDPAADALILDQRVFWTLLFLVLIVKGAGPFSADRFLLAARQRQAA
jgi:putative oxidoreductase